MNSPEPIVRRVEWGLLLVFTLLAAGIVTVGYFYYRNYERNYRRAAEEQILAVAELKVGELVQYRRERLGGANLLVNNPAFAALVRRFLDHPADGEATRQLEAWIGKYEGHYQYVQVGLLDARGVVRLSKPASPTPVAAGIVARVPEILRSGQASFEDFYRHEVDGRIYLSVMVPIRDEADGNRPLGVIVLGIDPGTYLYPFIKRWPTPSPTAETLLLRRDGNDALYLNDLRNESNAALAVRLPHARVDVPAVRAVLGHAGIMSGVDYRGVPVIAAGRAVPESPWVLIAKVDAAEVSAPLKDRLWQVIAMIGALLFGAGASVGLVWRQHRVRYYRERSESAAALLASESRYRRLFESSKIGILVLDAETGTVMDVNPFLVDMLGVSRGHLIGEQIWELAVFRSVVADRAAFVELQRKEYMQHEDLPLETADGRQIEVEVVVNSYRVNQHRVLQCNIRDISERKAAAARLQQTLAELERSNKELEQFAYVASHDLQEPLRMVSSYTQLLAERYQGQLDDRARKYIGYAVDGAVRMQALINDLLAYSRVGPSGRPLERAHSQAALREAQGNLAAIIGESRAVVTNDDLPTVRADVSQLVLVFQNLLANAIKFRGEDVPRIHVSAQDRHREWVFSISDNGIGIEPQHAERVFVIFQRLHTREEYPGTGIGLAVCQRIVERHGGKIWFESVPGNGATFFFTVPK